MRNMTKKRIKSFHLSVKDQFKKRIEKIFPLISDDQIPNFSAIVTWEIVQYNLDKNWSWIYLSKNCNITWEIVKANLDKEWDWSGLSMNPNITWEIVEANLDKDWDWSWLSDNPNITWEIV